MMMDLLLLALLISISVQNCWNWMPQSHPLIRYFHSTFVVGSDGKIPYDDLLYLVPSVTILQCSVECVSSDRCVSYFYKQQTKECQLYEGGSNTMPGSKQMRAGFKWYRFTEGLIGHSCKKTSDCIVSHSECRSDGVCGCVIGYSFQRDTHTCEGGCTEYGNTFQVHRSYCLMGDDAAIIENTPPEMCAEFCQNATRFLCLTFDISFNNCYLQSASALTTPWAVWYPCQSDHYQRNCA